MNEQVINNIRKLQSDNTLLKHEQIIEGIITSMDLHQLKKGDLLPSVNVSVEKLGIARKTLVKAYDELKKRGIIQAKKRLGYFIANTNTDRKQKVMLLFNSFNSYHQVLYESFKDNVPENAQLDIFFHHGNAEVFKSLLESNAGLYTHYIISPFESPVVKKAIKKINKKNLLIISRPNYKELAASSIVQDYSSEFEKALHAANHELKKYKEFIFVFSSITNPPQELKKSFVDFCRKASIKHRIVSGMEDSMIKDKAAFLLIEDNDMVEVMLKSKKKNFRIGKDVGIISYNESPVKEVIGEGITVISPDYNKIGQLAAEWLKTGKAMHIVLPTELIKRKSL